MIRIGSGLNIEGKKMFSGWCNKRRKKVVLVEIDGVLRQESGKGWKRLCI